MAEGPRSRTQPFRFWMAAGTSNASRSSPHPAALSRQKSQAQSTPSQRPVQAASPPPSPAMSRRPTSGRRDSQAPSSPASPQNRRRQALQSQPGTQMVSPSARRAASKTLMQTQTRSVKHSAATQVMSQLQSKFSLPINSQSQSPVAKRTPSVLKHESDQAMPVKADRNTVQPTSEPTNRNTRKEQNATQVTINSPEQQPVEYYSNTSLQTTGKENVIIKFKKMDHSQSITEQSMNPTEDIKESDLTYKEIKEDKLRIKPGKKEEMPSTGIDNTFKGQTEFSRNNKSNEERNEYSIYKPTRNGSNGKEKKIAVSTVPLDSLFDGKRAVFKEDMKEGLSRLAEKISAGYSSQPKNGSSAANVVTLAGKNNGASMVIDGHDLGKTEGMWNDGEKTGFTASINNNIQSINNSTIDDSSCRVGNPGVHLTISNKPVEKLVCEKTAEPLPTERRAPGPIISQKPAHEPRIRRRCLRALFMESSESDLENPQKPRRHGCRFNCEDKKKMKNSDQIAVGNASAKDNGEGPSKA